MRFDELLNLMRVKESLAEKYRRLAGRAHSAAKRRQFLGRSRWHRAQARDVARKIRLGTFVQKMDAHLIPRFQRSVVPIIRETYVVMRAGGSGTLFRVGNSSFLVTAAHALEACDQGLGLYIPRFGSRHLEQIHGTRHQDKNLDIAAVELDEDVVTALGDYCYLTLADADLRRQPTPPGLYYVYGYPAEFSFPSVAEAVIRTGAINIVARQFAPDPDIPASLHNDEFLLLQAFANTYDLNGISGCSMWLAHRDGDSPADWTNARAKVVAVETGTYRNHTVIEGTRIRHVFRLLREARPALCAEIDAHL